MGCEDSGCKSKEREYIKALRKALELGGSSEEKACLCSCKVPGNSKNEPIEDEKGKIGLFPFCIPLVDKSAVGSNTKYPIKMKLDEVMDLYWAKTVEVTISADGNTGLTFCDNCKEIPYIASNIQASKKIQKTRLQLLCGDWDKYWDNDPGIDGGAPSRCGKSNYPQDCPEAGEPLYFGVSFELFSPYTSGADIVKTSDETKNVDFYPKLKFRGNLGGGLAGGNFWTQSPYIYGSANGKFEMIGEEVNKTEDITLGGGRCYVGCCSNDTGQEECIWKDSNVNAKLKLDLKDFVP